MTILERKAALLRDAGAVECEACGALNVRRFTDVDTVQHIVPLGVAGECGACGQPVQHGVQSCR